MPDDRSSVQPVHTGAIAGKPIRFFRPPGAEPDFPWHVVSDLHAALGMPAELQAILIGGMFKTWRDDIRTVDIGAERLIIGPHYQALGLTSALDDALDGKGAAERAYIAAAAGAAEAMLGGLTVGDRIAYMLMVARQKGADPGEMAELERLELESMEEPRDG